MKKVSDSLTFRYRGLVGVICLFPIGVAIIFSSPLIAEDTFHNYTKDYGNYIVPDRSHFTMAISTQREKEKRSSSCTHLPQRSF